MNFNYQQTQQTQQGLQQGVSALYSFAPNAAAPVPAQQFMYPQALSAPPIRLQPSQFHPAIRFAEPLPLPIDPNSIPVFPHPALIPQHIRLSFYHQNDLLGEMVFNLSQVPRQPNGQSKANYCDYALYQVRSILRSIARSTKDDPCMRQNNLSALVWYQNGCEPTQVKFLGQDSLTLESFEDGRRVGRSGYCANPRSLNRLANQYNPPTRFC
jgi:hypothetical protein